MKEDSIKEKIKSSKNQSYKIKESGYLLMS